MKKTINYIAFLCLVAVLPASCKKDGANMVVTAGHFPGQLSASSSTVVLLAANDADTVEHFNWVAADFGQKPVITYTLQLDVPADTATWVKAKTFTVGNSLLYGFNGKDLNNLLNAMGLTAGAANAIAVRIRSDVNQYNGTASSVLPAYSNTIVLQITPYGLNLYIPGAYQNWDPSTAPALNPVTGKPGLYEAYEKITGGGIQYFKYTNAPDWNHINYGDGGNGTFSTDGAAGGLSVPDSGYYELTADLNKNTWTATKTTWGIIGDATPGGWNNDTQMLYDATKQVWTVTAAMIKNGSFKFRANNAWNIDFGIDAGNNLVYADNPFMGYTAGLNNLSVPEDGIYTITLDLHTSGKYLYNLTKN
jgi:hypothetical protein